MKIFIKIAVALVAVAGAVYVAATYGDKIVAWAKKTLSACKCRCGGNCDCEDGVESVADEVIAAETDFEG